jgi:stage III sporulation protein AG
MERGIKAGTEDPVLIKAVKPRIEGLLVIAEGAQDYRTKLALTRTVETLLNLPAHKITVQPMER